MSVDAPRNSGEVTLPVHLVGAGPGDPGLITRRGAELLATADAVFHDELVGSDILDLAPHATRFPVGRRAGNPGRDPGRTAAQMARLARRGQQVVRLKGGDSYLYGRGAEEAVALLAEGVPFVVVPGVSSAFAAPAAVGIPLTHRDLASSVTIITGHRRPEVTTARWRALALGADTLVVLMGGRRLEEVTADLVAAGRPPATPAAVVVAATTPRQAHLVTTLGSIAADARRLEMGTPAIMVVGEVVRLAETLNSPALPELVAASA
ncbi:MAG: uroporphyrinogen methyltransferase / synthase [Chloroflexota bacterium]|jgi:uroporphyrin-III C-methyltransferase|nr:uroporphyrinogen methyltransferase / synthase [Chloroflexota bacterium]